MFPRNIPIGIRRRASSRQRHRHLQEHPGAAVRRLLVAPVRARPRPEAGSMDGRSRRHSSSSSPRSLQLVVLTEYRPFGGPPSIVLVALLSIALLRGSVFGAAGRLRRRPAARHREPRHARLHLAAADARRASGPAATARRPRATASTRRTSPSRSSPCSTRSASSRCTSCSGEPAPAGLVPLGAAADGAPEPAPDAAGLRARPPALPAASSSPTASTRCGSLASTAGGRGRFLPGDPRVEEPYRLTPQLALRVAILGFLALAVFAVLFLRLWALQVLSGDRYLRAGERQPRAHAPARGAARADPRPQRQRARRERAGHEPRALAGRPAEDVARAAAGAAGALDGHRASPCREIVAQLKQHGTDPLTPVVVQRGHPAGPVLLPRGARCRVPRRAARRTATCASTRTSRSPRRCSATSARSPSRSTRRRKAGYQPTDSIGQAGVESDLRHATCGAGTARRSSRSTRAAGRRARSTLVAAAEPGRHAAAHARHQPPARRRAGAARRDQPRARRPRGRARRRRRDRRARPAERRGARDGVVPDLPAVGLRRAPRPGEARAAVRPEDGGRAELPGLNRAIDVAYPPGSTFKPVTALAAMQEGLVHPVRPAALHADFKALRADLQQLDAY